jgi:hypothetical protein
MHRTVPQLERMYRTVAKLETMSATVALVIIVAHLRAIFLNNIELSCYNYQTENSC